MSNLPNTKTIALVLKTFENHRRVNDIIVVLTEPCMNLAGTLHESCRNLARDVTRVSMLLQDCARAVSTRFPRALVMLACNLVGRIVRLCGWARRWVGGWLCGWVCGLVGGVR